MSDEQRDEVLDDERPADGIYLQFAGRERHQAFVRAPRVLMDVAEHGDPEGSPENLVIEGDNLDVMSALAFQYGEQVNVAIVDPPYGGDRQAVRYRDDSTGWLQQMQPTFYLIHKLLAETGVMFVHIDDDQLFNLGVLLDDIFDEQNRIAVIVWKSATDNNPSRVSKEHEYILVYAKNQAALPTSWRGQMTATKEAMIEEFRRLQAECGTDLAKLQKDWRAFMSAHKDEMPRGLAKMTETSLESPFEPDTDLGKPEKGGYQYEVIHPNGKPVKRPMRGWRYPKRSMDRLLADDLVAFGKDETKIPRKKKRLLDDLTGKLPSIINDFTASNDIARLFPEANGTLFPYPKPSELEEYLLSFVADKDALVLDPFGGSGTTAHAVMRLNKKDGGDRRFIIIERGNLANNDEYAVELTSERIRRARTVDGLPGGFTFLRVGDEINDDAWAKMQRDEVAGVIRQSDPSGKGRGLRKVDGRYVIGASARKQAVCLHWGGEDGGVVSRDVLRGMFEEVAELGLKLPMRVYGITCDVAETDDFTFCQLPDEVQTLLGHGRPVAAA